MEFIARHRITSGRKGERQIIEPRQRFNTDDYKDVSDKEWTAMLAQGTIMRPDDPSYAAVTGLQRRAADTPVVEGRITASQPEPSGEDDGDEETETKPRGRRGRRAASDDDDGEL